MTATPDTHSETYVCPYPEWCTTDHSKSGRVALVENHSAHIHVEPRTHSGSQVMPSTVVYHSTWGFEATLRPAT